MEVTQIRYEQTFFKIDSNELSKTRYSLSHKHFYVKGNTNKEIKKLI